jgi:Destabilase
MFRAVLALVALAIAVVPARGQTAAPALRPASADAPWTLDELLDAIRQVESGGLKDGGRKATGDGGKAIGPYQIHKPYWEDSKVPGAHDDCRDPAYARKVVLAYWKRYAPKSLASVDAQSLARVHNGGPDGAKQDCTLTFWSKVERQLKAAREKRAQEAEAKAKKANPPPPAPKGKSTEYC